MNSLASMLVDAHRSGERIFHLEDKLVPPDAPAAMQVQAEVAMGLDETVAGWKVGMGPERSLAAPIFGRLMLSRESERPLASQGIFGVEVEVAVRLGRDLAPRNGIAPNAEEIMAAIDSLLVGIEVIESRFADHRTVPFNAFLADNLGNGGYARGEEIAWKPKMDLANLQCRAEIDGKTVFEGKVSHHAGDPLAPLLAYAGDPNDALGGLRKGQVITTGSLCGVLPIEGTCSLKATLDGIGEVTLRFV